MLSFEESPGRGGGASEVRSATRRARELLSDMQTAHDLTHAKRRPIVFRHHATAVAVPDLTPSPRCRRVA